MASQFPGIAEWLLVGQSWEKLNGQGGHDIGVLKLTNKAITGNKPKLFINSAIHAREYTTAPLVLDFARWLVNGYGTDADATWILDHHEVHLMLQTNPDGRKKAETGLSWRKNANQNYCGANSNNRGADLNRNFTFGWNSTNGQGSSGSACNDTYRGPSAGSEPEIQTLEAYVRSLWPDRRGPAKMMLRQATPAASTWTFTATANWYSGPGAIPARRRPTAQHCKLWGASLPCSMAIRRSSPLVSTQPMAPVMGSVMASWG